MTHHTPTKVLLTTTFQPLVAQLSGSLVSGARLMDQFLHDEPTPQKMMDFEKTLSILLREVGRRIMTWTCNHLESESNDEAPSRLQVAGQWYRRRGKHRTVVSTLFGTGQVRRRFYEPLARGARAIHPLELRLGVEAGLATPALAERVGRWAAEHTQRQVLAMLVEDAQVQWSCTSLRKVLASLRTGLEPHRQPTQIAQVVNWLAEARVSTGRFRPTQP